MLSVGLLELEIFEAKGIEDCRSSFIVIAQKFEDSLYSGSLVELDFNCLQNLQYLHHRQGIHLAVLNQPHPFLCH